MSKNTALTTLNCNNNRLAALDVSKNTALTTLNCNNNRLSALELTRSPELSELYCHDNRLFALNLAGNRWLESWGLTQNNIEITVGPEGIDLSTLPGFDPARVSGLQNAVISDGRMIPAPGAENITYTYDCGVRDPAEMEITMKCTLSLSAVVPEGAMALPGDLREIGSEAFTNVQARAFVLPGNVESIAPDAFPADAVLYFPRGSQTGQCLRDTAGLPLCLTYQAD